MDIRISKEIMEQETDVSQERNIYAHPDPIARDGFWQRLERLDGFLRAYAKPQDRVLDFGGGSGAFVLGLSRFFNRTDIIDMDISDARSLVDHFRITNINLIQGDIRQISPGEPYDHIIAADVLEHFQDLRVPLDFLKKNLSAGGLLFISVPTENWVYNLVRVVGRKTKPLEHYHSAAVIIDFLRQNGFQVIRREFAPRYLVNIPLFEICVFRRS
ncbi:MAG: class I SAM-dependent methyltransferase [Candidatus Omnitrophica bacterium]|nr:class I SAM-dependent methyltransferase [Candidatus Omnitrophota bacterium]